HVRQAVGWTPGTDTAYTPGEGGIDPGTGVQSPLSGKSGGKAGAHDAPVVADSCVAPPETRSASVTVPPCTLPTSVVFDGGPPPTGRPRRGRRPAPDRGPRREGPSSGARPRPPPASPDPPSPRRAPPRPGRGGPLFSCRPYGRTPPRTASHRKRPLPPPPP